MNERTRDQKQADDLVAENLRRARANALGVQRMQGEFKALRSEAEALDNLEQAARRIVALREENDRLRSDLFKARNTPELLALRTEIDRLNRGNDLLVQNREAALEKSRSRGKEIERLQGLLSQAADALKAGAQRLGVKLPPENVAVRAKALADAAMALYSAPKPSDAELLNVVANTVRALCPERMFGEFSELPGIADTLRKNLDWYRTQYNTQERAIDEAKTILGATGLESLATTARRVKAQAKNAAGLRKCLDDLREVLGVKEGMTRVFCECVRETLKPLDGESVLDAARRVKARAEERNPLWVGVFKGHSVYTLPGSTSGLRADLESFTTDTLDAQLLRSACKEHGIEKGNLPKTLRSVEETREYCQSVADDARNYNGTYYENRASVALRVLDKLGAE